MNIKIWVRVKNGAEKLKKKKLGIGGVLGWIVLCLNAVLVLVLTLALRVLLPGAAG